jgi:hypothetical protein
MAEDEPVTLPNARVAEAIDDTKWQTLVESGGRRAQARGLTEDDVPRLVAEARRERQAR